MKKTVSLILYVIILSGMIRSEAQTCNSNNLAIIQKKHTWESGILQPFRYGVSTKIEFRSHILLFPLMPNAGIRIGYHHNGNYLLASEHEVSVPSVFLNAVSRKGIGGLLSPEFDFPFMLGLNNKIMLSLPICDSLFLTTKAAVHFAVKAGEVDPLATIDFPMIYPRMTHYYEGVSIRLGTSVNGKLIKRLSFEGGVECFVTKRKENN